MGVKQLELNKGYFVTIDECDFDFLSKYKWHARVVKSGAVYALSHECFNGRHRTVYMHRLIMNPMLNEIIDHIDGNPLNNCRNNLRVCKRSENNRNRRRVLKGCKSKYKGVYTSYRKERPWKAIIQIDKKVIQIGRFKNEKEAALAYNAAALKYHGEFACLNLI